MPSRLPHPQGRADGGDIERLRTTATALGVLSALSAVIVFASGGAGVHTPWLGGVGNLPTELWPVGALQCALNPHLDHPHLLACGVARGDGAGMEVCRDCK